MGIGLEQAPFLREIIRNDGDAGAVQQRIAGQDAPGRAEQGIGMGQALLDAPGIVPHGRFHILQRVQDQVRMGREFHPGHPFLPVLEQLPGVEILRNTHQHQQEGEQEDEDQAGALPFLEEFADMVDKRDHPGQSSKKRKESKSRKIMST